MTVNLNGAGSSVALQIGIEGTVNTGSLEQLTVNSAGSAANTLTLGTADFDGTGTSYTSASGITKITVTGSQALTLKTDHATLSSKTLEKTGTGSLTLDVDRGTATSAITSLAQASGYSSVVLRGTGDVNVTGIVNNATVTLVDSFTATSADALSVKGASTGTADSLTLVLDHKTDLTNLSFGAAFAVNDVETLSIVSNGGDTTGNTLGDTATTGGFEANAAKTISLSGDTKLTLNLDTDDKFETLNIVGAAKYAVDFVGTSSVTYDSSKNVTVNANTSTADLTLDLSQVALATAVSVVEKMTVATGTGADTITGGSFAGAQLNLDAGDGANVITAGNFGAVGTASSDAYTSANTIVTGAGNDQITIGNVLADSTYVKASMAITAGNGDNTIVVTGDGTDTANISGEISITTGTGKDAIVFGASATATAFEVTTAKLTVTTGAGDDTVKLHNVTKNGSTIDLGDGVDKLYVGVADTGTAVIVNDVAITTGAGKDTIYLSNTASGVTTTGANVQKITITDFTAGTTGDVLNLTGWTGTGFASSFGTATAGVTNGLVKLGAFDLANITAMGSSNAFNVAGVTTTAAATAVAVLFNNNTGLTEVWMASDVDGSGSGTSIVAEKIATLENVTLMYPSGRTRQYK
jgi:phage-related protein